ncbi:MAG: MBOAT family protein [Anaerolineaceae bacterium]|nr:MBOAT family protein [Anaerolineaceae bacterium]
MRWRRVNNFLLFIFGILVYSWGGIERGILLLFLTVIDFLIVKYFFPDKKKRTTAFAVGMLANLLPWLFFKYVFHNNSTSSSFSFPIGLSFYMLRKISYLIDNFRKKGDCNFTFIEYGICVSFFPQILSGPIERPTTFIKKIREKKAVNFENLVLAGKLLTFGMVKKVVIADNLRLVIDRIFQLNHPSRLLAGIGVLGFSVQLYSDFSAYIDISRGIAYLLGIESAANFNRPFLAKSPRDFWNRWHITFSNWIQSYIFNPIRRFCLKRFGNSSLISELVPPLLTMTLSGIWHGNGLTYIIWGIYHGILIFFYRIFGFGYVPNSNNKNRLFLRWLITFGLIQLGWVFFRAPNMGWVYSLVTSSSWGFSGSQFLVSLSVLSLIFMYALPLVFYLIIMRENKSKSFSEPLFYAASVILLIVFSNSGVQEFVYSGF